MIQKTFAKTLSVLMAFTVWGATLMFAVLIGVLALRIVVITGFTIYHLAHP